MNPLKIIDEIYKNNLLAKRILIAHVEVVAQKALQIANNINGVDKNFIYEAAILHDIGILKTNAKDLHCFGEKPYICHGVLGRKILEKYGLHKHGLVAERHVGFGIDQNEIVEKNLGLPNYDMQPVTMEEIIVCMADKFFSKSNANQEKSIEEIIEDAKKYGQSQLEKFYKMAELLKIKV